MALPVPNMTFAPEFKVNGGGWDDHYSETLKLRYMMFHESEIVLEVPELPYL